MNDSSVLLDDTQLAALREFLRSRPQIAEAWLIDTRMIPADGSTPWQASMIGLVVDVPDEYRRRVAMLSYTPEKLADLFDAMNLRARWNHNEKNAPPLSGGLPGSR